MIKLIDILIEGNIKNDATSLAKELMQKGVAQDAYPTTSGFGRPLGKLMVKMSTNGKKFDDLKKEIENHYQKTPQSTSLSSTYYYSPTHKLYFYFYPMDKEDRAYNPKLDKTIAYDYRMLVKRRLPKK